MLACRSKQSIFGLLRVEIKTVFSFSLHPHKMSFGFGVSDLVLLNTAIRKTISNLSHLSQGSSKASREARDVSTCLLEIESIIRPLLEFEKDYGSRPAGGSSESKKGQERVSALITQMADLINQIDRGIDRNRGRLPTVLGAEWIRLMENSQSSLQHIIWEFQVIISERMYFSPVLGDRSSRPICARNSMLQ